MNNCDTIKLLLSKYVDGEASSGERAVVDTHIASCEGCSLKLTSFMEMAAIFSDAGARTPEPHLRVTLFSRIERIKAEEERLARLSQTSQQPTPILISPSAPPARGLAARLWSAAGSYAMVGTAMFAVLAVVILAARTPAETVFPAVPDATSLLPEAPPTIPYQMAVSSRMPSPVVTTAAVTRPRTATRSATARVAAATGEMLLELQRPTPVFERGDVTHRKDWHEVRDPASGYTIEYPPNWWTQVSGNTRLFFPWGPGGSRNAPYWLSLEIKANPQQLDAGSANAQLLGGKCKRVENTRNGSSCRQHSYVEGSYRYDELYAFDNRHIYKLRLSVPEMSEAGSLEDRWTAAEEVFTRMSGTLSLAPNDPGATGGYSPLLFQNGTDLWVIDVQGRSTARPVTQNYSVRAYALSPDLRHVAFLASHNASDPFVALHLYVVDLYNSRADAPQLIWSGVEMLDLAWYGDRELVLLARGGGEGASLYRISIVPPDVGTPTPDLLVSLGQDMRGAGGLAVSPDRQLITFLAPLGGHKGTSLYGVRPDGSEIARMISYDDPEPLAAVGMPGREDQALKKYLWTGGRLEYDGYSYSMLFTCGGNLSPTLVSGGGLYSAPGFSSGSLLNPRSLNIANPAQMQIVHIAYSPHGKLAFTGFYNDVANSRDGLYERPETLAGMWTADLRDGTLVNLQSLPIPDAPRGISDLQWSPDGKHLIYRETVPQNSYSMASRYDAGSPFALVRLNLVTGERVELFSSR